MFDFLLSSLAAVNESIYSLFGSDLSRPAKEVDFQPTLRKVDKMSV